MLFLVPTPIGNLGDMTLRAIQVLKDSDIILAEDTRVSRKLLNHFNIEKSLQSFHSQNEHHLVITLIEKLKAGKMVSLITDAGTPGISDPAYLLVRACRQEGINVSALPGATAFVPALVASGIPCDKFYFQGFLPQKKGRKTQIEFLEKLSCTIVLYESPHRIIKCLEEFIQVFGGQRICCVAREISKMFETYYNGSLEEVLKTLKSLPKIKGEIVLVLDSKRY
ncbi:MAG: 16S rRNA (cytidine(1402)-2'-O)-methyltransferase [Bacteroidota bacterium]|nr:16S rRNA (cytidine(1402)-2'-O)-methyltransferase [Bacteroidota bacterium]